jgi:hypothetical protein
MRMGNTRFWSVFWLLTVAVAIGVAWFLGNLLYTVFWTVLGDRGFPITEAKMTAYIAAHLLPFLLTLLVGAILSLLIRRQIANTANSQENTYLQRASSAARFIGVMEAIYWIAHDSAWGRWKEAQYRASGLAISEIFKLTTAEQFFRRSAENGEIIVKARLAKSVDYTSLDQHFWHSAYFDIKENVISIWATTIKARSAEIQIPEYDAAIVERTRVEALWRRRDWRYDLPALRLKFRSMWKRMKDQKSNEPQKATEEAPAGPPAVPVTHHVVSETGMGLETTVETTISAGANAEITVTAAAPDNWEQLFAIGDDGRSVWLKFLPDTKHYRADALLVIVYGQKVLLGTPRIRIEAAHAAVDKTVQNAPNRPRTSNAFLASVLVMRQLTEAANLDWIDECVPQYLERVGLSRGGFYQLTQDGERRAAGLAYDLIRRA